ncbi:MAG: hypothetical protein HWQ38_21385 [Nostoc sp. NMS7]|uniref:hypothetical protein n=1 Tax=Nostoc sp. NMS7 TaxID=2815391 RepID=UPI0025DF3136|nr:hypothetical protein [Nostoc sp. NMS7]MBN3948873.1 hypothetical protein [Nostoc sp. NMS7]
MWLRAFADQLKAESKCLQPKDTKPVDPPKQVLSLDNDDILVITEKVIDDKIKKSGLPFERIVSFW